MWHLRILFLKFWEICTESGAYFVLSGESGLMTSVFILQNPTFLCTNTSLMFTDLEGTSFSKPSHVLQERLQLFITKSSSSEVSWHLYTFSVIFNCVAAETQHRADRVKQTAAETLHSVSGFISAAVSVLSSQVLLTRPAGRKRTSPEGQMKLCCHLWAQNGTATTMWSLFTCSCKHQCSTSCCYCLNMEVLK